MSDVPAPLVVNGRFLRATPTGLHRVARHLVAELRRMGVDVEVLAPAGVTDPLADRVTWAPPGRLGDHLWEQAVLPALAGRRPVVSLANTAPIGAPTGIVMVHDLATVVGPAWFRRPMRLYGALSLRAARRAEAVVTPSHQVAGELAAHGVAPARVHVVPNGIDPSLRPAPPDAVAAARRRLGLHRPYVLHVGWADPRKNVALAVAAHRAVVAELPHDLVLVGLPHRNFVPVSVPTDPTVRLVGFVDDAELVALLTGAHALLYPSRYEGFGLPPLEAMACGTPALVSDLPAIREATGAAATLLPVDDVAAWADALRTALAGTATVAPPPTRTWADMASDLLAVLTSVGITRPRSGPAGPVAPGGPPPRQP